MLRDRFLYDARDEIGDQRLTNEQDFKVRMWAYTRIFSPVFDRWGLIDIYKYHDPIHHIYHQRETSSFSKAIGEELGWSEETCDFAYFLGSYLDIGYQVAQTGAISHQDHAFASAFLTLVEPTIYAYRSRGENIRKDSVLAVLYHPLDRQPENASKLSRVLQAADRLAGLPPYGFFSYAYFNDFRDPVYEKVFKYESRRYGFIEAKQIDLRDPRFVDRAYDSDGKIISTSYMAGMRQSCNEIIFPWLKEKGLIKEAIDYGETLLNRIYGIPGKVDQILPEAIKAFPVKLFVAEESLRQLKEYS